MKRILALALAVIMLAVGMSSGVTAHEEDVISIVYQETAMSLEAQPQMIDGSVIAPLRSFVQSIGSSVEWDFRTETAVVKQGDITMELRADAETAVLNGEEIKIPARVRKINGLLYVPVRFLAETLGYAVSWDEASSTVKIGNPESNQPADIGNIYTIVGVSASEDDGNVPENVLDRNYDTRWSALSRGAYITLELEQVQPVAYIGIACHNGTQRISTISVQVSQDGQSFKEVVTYFVTSHTSNMEPVDLGGVYDAKYIRVLGYGNSTNDWNSITELSVYGPYEDGTMPVATDGPNMATASLEDLPPETQAALKNYDEMFFERLDVLYANLYDKEEHGFYMAMSGKDDPNQQTAIEMTDWVIVQLRGFEGWEGIPDEVRQQWIDYFLDRQDPATGLFIDKQGPVNDRETSRNQSAAIGALSTLGVSKYRYTHPSQLEEGQVATDSTLKPDYVNSISDYIDWIESLNWDGDSWTAGDQMQSSLKNLKYYMKPEEYERCIETLVEWLTERQFENGLWADYVNFNSISGAMKVGYALNELGRRYPNPDAVLESVSECFEVDMPTASMHMANPFAVLNFISKYSPEYQEKVRNIVLDKMDKVIAWTELFATPDGGFSINYRRSQASFGGVAGSHQLWEADVDSCSMFMTVRGSLYSLLGANAPRLKLSDDFWDWITGKKEPPSPYLDPKYDVVSGKADSNPYIVDFEDQEVGTMLSGTEFGGSTFSNMTGEIVKDKDRRDNKAVALTYEGNGIAGPTFTVKLQDYNDISAVRYIPLKNQIQVVEYDLKVENAGAQNNFYINHGVIAGYYLNFSTSNVAMSIRISDSNVNYGGTMRSLMPKEWYRIRVEAHFGETSSDYFTKVFVDGEEVGSNNYNYGYPSVQPGKVGGSFALTWYRAGVGTVYLDNLMSYTKSL